MHNINAGRIKTYILVFLIITSLVLCGSLWFEDYHGFSNFLAKFSYIDFSKLIGIGKEDIQTRYERIILPSKVIVNNGEEGHWILYPSNNEHEKFWKIAKTLLKSTVTDTQTKANLVDSTEWNGLTTKSSIIMYFDYPLGKEILSMLFKIDEKKIKEDTNNLDSITITRFGQNIIMYTKVLENGREVFRKYYFPDSNQITDKDFEQIFNNSSLIKYASLKEALPNVKLNLKFQDNVFIPIFSFSDARRKSLKLGKVEFLPELSIANDKKAEEMVNKFFSGRDYSKFVKKDGANIFIDENNDTLRIFSDGSFEFELSQENNDSFDFKQAMNLALSYVEKYGGLENLFVSDIERSEKQAAFRFDYAVNGIPVDCSRGKNSLKEESAVEVAVSPELVKYKRCSKKFKLLEGEYAFSSDHDSIINAIFENAGVVKGNIEIREIKLEYKSADQYQHRNLPVWRVSFVANGSEKSITVEAAKDGR
ncbi:MAG: two-component system activity regulator YycH [Ignavibacteriales bacterium]